MKITRPPSYHRNSFVATHAFGYMKYVFMIVYIYYAHLASVRFEHSVCCGSLMPTFVIYLCI